MTEPADRAVVLLQKVSELLLESREIAQQLEVVPDGESSADAADRIAYGILVAALEEGLVNTIRHALDVLKRFRAPAGILAEQWLREQEGRLGKRESSPLWSVVVGLIPSFGRPDDRNHPYPLSLIRHWNQLLPMPAPFDVASHAEERPADLAERLVAIPADRNLTPALRPRTWLGQRGLAVQVESGRRHGA